MPFDPCPDVPPGLASGGHSPARLHAGFNFTRLAVHSNNPHMTVLRIRKLTDAENRRSIGAAEELLTQFVEHIANRAGRRQSQQLQCLDVGGNSGKGFEMRIRRHVNYTSLDFVAAAPARDKKLAARRGRALIGNIQTCNRHIPAASYDLVMASSVFEHLLMPWRAAVEMVRLARPGGYIAMQAPFSSRYHAYPIDTLRLTHTMARFLFERTGRVRTLFAGYAIDPDHRGWSRGHYADHSDEPPIPELQSNVGMSAIWIGQKDVGAQPFRPETLDTNAEFRGAKLAARR